MFTTAVGAVLLAVPTLTLLFGAAVRCVTILITIVATLFHALNGVTRIFEALENFLHCLGPIVTFTTAGGFLGEAHVDRVSLANVTLKVHVGESSRKWFLKTDEPKVDVLGNEALLNSLVGRLTTQRLHVLLDGFLCILSILIKGGLGKLFPSSRYGDILDVLTVDLAGSSAL